MNSTPNPTATDPNDVLVARADERLAHAYEQISHADEQIARVTEQISKLEQGAVRRPSAVPGRLRSRDRPVLRGLSGLLLAACIFVAAFVSQSSYGDTVKPIIARWAPQLILASSLPQQKPELLAQPNPSTARLAAAEPARPQPAPLAPSALPDGAPTTAQVSPEPELLQKMARDLATMAQEIEELKASQRQMASDNAKAIEQIKASQEQMAHLIARVSEQNLRSKTLAPQPRPTATTTSKPVPPPASPHATARPRPEDR